MVTMTPKPLLLCVLLELAAMCCWQASASSAMGSPALPEQHDDKFYYFGYGSNMLAKRIHLNNPTAVKIGIGCLMEHRLDFASFSKRWGGAPATVVPTQTSKVYGTLWDIDMRNLANIDQQEGVHEGIYYATSLPVYTENGTMITARVYILRLAPDTILEDFSTPEGLPRDRQPSRTYLQCLVKGAIETGVPTYYLHWLKSIKHNGFVSAELEKLLELKNVALFLD